ncbi:MAG: tetratricopeptide repeat protein [Geitlerinemataceae cyanobacterium]
MKLISIIKSLLRQAADFLGFYIDDEFYKPLYLEAHTQHIAEIQSRLEMPGLEIDEQASLYWELGRLFADEGDDEMALLNYDRAIALQPDFHKAWNNRGNSLNKLGRYEEAIKSFDRSLALKPNDHYAWKNRGNSLNKLGR